METLLLIVLVGIVFSLVVNILRPHAQPQIIYIETQPNPNADLGCLPLVLIGLAMLVYVLLAGS